MIHLAKRIRNEQIRQLRPKYTMAALGRMHGLSSERIRQILNPVKLKYCKRHERNVPHKKICSLCHILAYYPKVLNEGDIEVAIKLLIPHDRKIETVYMRALLAKKLYNDYGLSLPEIGRVLKRHHTTILNLVHKQL